MADVTVAAVAPVPDPSELKLTESPELVAPALLLNQTPTPSAVGPAREPRMVTGRWRVPEIETAPDLRPQVRGCSLSLWAILGLNQ
ncbi:hypothetical protein [Nocardioides sp. L-11A]|uniref:hypothetical protein n=1 Tax=Nocardioides sp. L-11A TaxID=3043848 RepID=UPI00249A9086|nr:hypothetical protein QJ852_12820 [Nocardioides sp. L-11A]